MKYNTVILAELLQPKGYIRGPFGSALKRSEMLSAGVPVYEQQHAIYNNRIFRFFISEKKLCETWYCSRQAGRADIRKILHIYPCFQAHIYRWR